MEAWDAAYLGGNKPSIGSAPELHAAQVGRVIFDRGRRTWNSNLEVLPLCTAQSGSISRRLLSMDAVCVTSNNASRWTNFGCEVKATLDQSFEERGV